jgi:hypothetical protein
MGIDRRDFVRLAAVLATGALGAACPPRQTSLSSQRRLNVYIRGLSLVRRSGNAFTLYFVDATKFDPSQFHVVEHHPYLSVRNEDIDSASTAPRVDDGYESGRKVFDLKNKTVTLDAGLSGSPDVGFSDDNIGEDLPDDAHWKSVRYAARLPTLCGATMITDTSKFCGTLTLEHGRLEGIKPKSEYGRKVVWNFTRKVNGATQKVVKQAMTDTLNCEVDAANSTAIFNIGSQTAVVKLPATVYVQNLPLDPSAAGTCKGPTPCVDHMAMFYELVDKQWVPDATAEPQPPPPVGASVDPDYCPPGSI